MLSILATLGFAAIAMLPGWLSIMGRARHSGEISAAMTVSLTLAMLLTALAGVAWDALAGGQLPASSLAVTSALMIVASLAARRNSKGASGGARLAVIEWEAVILAGLFCLFGLASLAIAVVEGENGDLLVHTWYNADWFKHIGHVHALANSGVPARDIFGGNAPLYYYWLFYLLPGAGAATGGDAWSALSAANAVVGFLFITTLHGFMRLAGGRAAAICVTTLILFVAAPVEAFVRLLSGETPAEVVASGALPLGPTLMPLAQFIPQHTLAVSLFLAWALLSQEPNGFWPRRASLPVLLALALILTISTLLGAILLFGYGLAELWRRREKALGELGIMLLLVVALTFAIGVLQIGRLGSTLESPLFINPPNPYPWYARPVLGILAMVGYCGFPAVAALVAFRRWHPCVGREWFAWTLVVALAGASVLAVAATQAAAPPRIAIEMQLRSIISFTVAIGLVGVWAIDAGFAQGGKDRAKAALVLALAVAIALPHFYARTAWMGDFSNPAFTRVPAQDRQALAALRERSSPADEVWQYPETPAFAKDRGDDNWSAIFAGRKVSNSLRATDFTPAAPAIELSQRFFAGEDVPIPDSIDWVYLSRALHPDSFDALRERMSADPAFARHECYEDACIFERRSANRP